eukprot:1208726-Amphidinium_carterae.1
MQRGVDATMLATHNTIMSCADCLAWRTKGRTNVEANSFTHASLQFEPYDVHKPANSKAQLARCTLHMHAPDVHKPANSKAQLAR